MDSKQKSTPKKINIHNGEYNLLLDSFAVMIHDFQGNIIELNDEFCRMLGGYREQLINKNIHDFIPEEAMDPTVMKRLRRHNVVSFKTIFFDKRGKKVHADVNSKVLDEKKSLVLARAKDISAEMRAKANSDRLNKILHAITDIQHLIVMGKEIDPVLQKSCEILVDSRSYSGCGIGVLNPKTKLIELHSQAGGYLFERKWQCDVVGKGYAPTCIREALSNGNLITIKNSQRCDCKYKNKPGHYKSVSLPITHGNQNIGIIHIAAKKEIVIDNRERELLQNISDALSVYISDKFHEQEIADKNEQLKESKEKYYSLFTNAPLSYQSLDETGHIIDVNPRWLSTLGYERQEVIGKWFGDFLTPDFVDHFRENFPRFKKAGSISGVQFKMKHKDGRLIYVEFEGCISYNADGSFSQTYCVFKDITEEKKLFEELKVSEEKYRLLIENSPDITYIYKAEKGAAYWSPQVKTVLGFDPKRLTDDPFIWHKAIHPEDITRVKEAINLAEKGVSYDLEYRIKDANGLWHWLHDRTISIKNREDELVLEGIASDITEKKQKNIKLENITREFFKLNHELQTILDTLPALVFYADKHGNFLRVNKSMANAHKMTKIEMRGKNVSDLYPEDEASANLEETLAVVRKNQPVLYKEESWTADEEKRWLSTSKVPFKNQNGQTVGVIGISMDITELKRSESELRKREAYLNSIFKAAPIGIGTVSHRVFDKVNQTMCDMLGYTKDELIGKNTQMIYPSKKEYEYVGKEKHRQIRDHGIGTVETRLKRKDGKIIDVILSSSPTNPENPTENVTFTCINISDRKAAEVKLKANKLMLDETGRMAKVGGWQIDMATKEVHWTDEVYRIHELPLDYKLQLDEAINFFHPDDRETLSKAIDDAFKGKGYDLELKFITAKDKELWTRTIGKPILKNGKVVKIFGTFQDITEEKLVKDNLRNKNALLTSIMETSPVGITTVDKDGNIDYANKQAEEILELEKSEVKGVSYDAPIWKHTDLAGNPFPDDQQPFYIVKTTKKPVFGVRHGISRKKDERKILSINAAPLLNEQGEFDGMIASIEDITQQRKIEQELEKSEEKFRLTFKTSPDSINLNRLEDGVYIDINKGFTNIMGYTPEDVIGKSSIDINIWKNLDDRKRLVKGLKEKGTVDNLEAKFIAKDGTVKHGLMSANIIKLNDEKVIINITRDITKRKELENEVLEREERFHNMLNCIPDLVSVHDKDFNIVYSNWNEFGAVPKEKQKLGTKCYQTYRGYNAVCPDCWVKEVMKTQKPFKNEIILPDGTWLDARVIPLMDEKNDVYAIMEWVRDITPRKQDEQKLANSEKKFRDLFNNLPLGIFTSTFAGEVLSANPAMAKIYGYDSVDDLLNRKAVDYYADPTDRDKLLNTLKEEKILLNHRTREKQKDGSEIWVETNYKLNYDKDNNINIIDGIADNVTDQVNKEEKLQKLSAAVQQSPSIFVITDLNGKIEYVNPKFTEITGYTLNEVKGKNPSLLKSGELDDAVYQDLWHKITHGESWRGEFHNRKKNNELFWESAAISPIFNQAGKPINYIKVSENITLQKEMEMILKLNEEKYRNIFQNAPVGIMQFDENRKITDCNKRLQEIVEVDKADLIGKDMIDDLRLDRMKEKAGINFAKGGIFEDWFPSKKDGKQVYIKAQFESIRNAEGDFVTGICLVEDITHQKRLAEMRKNIEAQKQTSQKLETIGTMAGGIAHDFNNILTPILGYSGLIKKHSDKESRIYDEINEIFNAGLRAKDLISQILNFSRQTETQKMPLKIHLILNEALKLMRPSIPAIIDLKSNVDKECPMVMVDGSKMHQVFINICTNAAHAIGENPGTITVTMSETAAENDELLKVHEIFQGYFCKISFKDTGAGIPPEIRDRIFDPFFTTKEQGKGTGLGLSVVHGIIKEHEGHIFVDSELGVGTTFSIYLPVIEEEETDVVEDIREQEIIKGKENILVVDDRPELIKMVNRMLSALGYTITTFTDPEEALQYYKNNAKQVDLLFSDYSMPKMSGLDLAEKIRKVTPGIPVIIATGNTVKLNPEKVKRIGIDKVINKPLMIFEVSKTIRELLDHKNRENKDNENSDN
ncbi:MAG: PAS domain S-box protein [Fidelibacterota bacterium]